MPSPIQLLLPLLLITFLQEVKGGETELEEASTDQLEARLDEIDSTLAHLATFTMRSGIGAIGHRSDTHSSSQATEWIEIDLGRAQDIDQIVLVPTIERLPREGLAADGFPRSFQVIVGSPDHPEGEIIARFNASDRLLPRIAPLTIPCQIPEASWIRITATELTPRSWDNKFIFQLAEILVFQGQKNLALRRPVKASSGIQPTRRARSPQYVVDGSLPYLMAAYDGQQSIAFLGKPDPEKYPTVTLDLGIPQAVSQINLHSIDVEDTIPQSVPPDFAIPRKLLIEGALLPDFSDATPLLRPALTSPFERVPILRWPLPENTSRFIRFVIEEPDPGALDRHDVPTVGFAEIEVLAGETNLARGKTVLLNFAPTDNRRKISALTDGRNYHGSILPSREWVNQLALRHDLETERPLVESLLKKRYAQQERNLNRLLWILPLLLTGSIILVLVNRINQQRALHRARELIAADLHDELGANLHAIGLLGDLARASDASTEKREKLLLRIRDLTQKTGAAARYCTNMLEAKENYEDVDVAMRRSSSRLLADLEHELTFEGEEHLKKLSPRRRIDICLFYKECLTNILRHSGASKVITRLKADKSEILLEISDNGFGIEGLSDDKIPSSLKRRARILGAHLHIDPLTPQGLKVTLKISNRKWRLKK